MYDEIPLSINLSTTLQYFRQKPRLDSRRVQNSKSQYTAFHFGYEFHINQWPLSLIRGTLTQIPFHPCFPYLGKLKTGASPSFSHT